MPKYTVDQVKENLKKLKQKLKDKGRNEGFWVIASRSDFKPLVLEETIKGKTTTKTLVDIDDVKKELLEGKEQYFKNKIFAYIHFFILSNFLTDKEFNEKNIKNIKNEKISGINIDIFTARSILNETKFNLCKFWLFYVIYLCFYTLFLIVFYHMHYKNNFHNVLFLYF